MEYRKLGKSGLKVSEIGLGTNRFGQKVDEQTAEKIINRAAEVGINFIDTAELYVHGRSEETIGRVLKGKRSQFIIATKFAHREMVKPWESGGSRNYVMKAVDGSLRRLNTDYIDLYYFHFPDPGTPIEETLRAMNDLVHAGKVRYIGCSNFAGWQLCEALWTSRMYNLEPFIATEPKYNLLDRGIEKELVPCSLAHGVGVVPWGPLASGFLTGKFRRGQEMPKDAWLLNDPPPIYLDVVTDANFDKIARLEAFAKERGHSLGELAVAWLLAHPWVSSIIAGSTTLEQLEQNMAGAGWKMTAEDMAQIDKIS